MIPLIYTKIEPERHYNVFLVTFSFEHGDADKTTTDEMLVPLSKEEFVHYLDKVKDVSKQIDDARSCGACMPRHFEDSANYNGVFISIELDCFARVSMSNYYASMRIQNIVYFDEAGDKFNVT